MVGRPLSAIDHPCDRRSVWRFTRAELQRPHYTTVQSIFDLGRESQSMIFRKLDKLGLELVAESDRPVEYRVGRAIISGRPDGRVAGFRGERTGRLESSK